MTREQSDISLGALAPSRRPSTLLSHRSQTIHLLHFPISNLDNLGSLGYELKILVCCISCRHINNSPKGHVTAGPSCTSSAQSQSVGMGIVLGFCWELSAWAASAFSLPFGVDCSSYGEKGSSTPLLVSKFRRVSTSMQGCKECNNNCVDAYGPIRLSRTADDKRDRTCRKRWRWRERSVMHGSRRV